MPSVLSKVNFLPCTMSSPTAALVILSCYGEFVQMHLAATAIIKMVIRSAKPKNAPNLFMAILVKNAKRPPAGVNPP